MTAFRLDSPALKLITELESQESGDPDLLSELLNGQEDANRIIADAKAQGLVGLLNHQLSRFKDSEKLSFINGGLRHLAMTLEAVNLAREESLAELFTQAEAEGVSLLVFKGAALAYLYYPSPGFRSSCDVDLLVCEQQVPRFRTLLVRLGFQLDQTWSPSRLSFQFSAKKPIAGGHILELDIHYQINNQIEYQSHFNYEDLLSRAIALPAYGPAAQAVSTVDALIIACVHLQGHYRIADPIKAIWLKDIDLLLQNMNKTDEQALLARLQKPSISKVVAFWLYNTKQYFDTSVDVQVQQYVSGIDYSELTRISPAGEVFSQISNTHGLTAKAAALSELLFPSTDYMRAKYAGSVLPLPVLYVVRAFAGIRKRILKQGRQNTT